MRYKTALRYTAMMALFVAPVAAQAELNVPAIDASASASASASVGASEFAPVDTGNDTGHAPGDAAAPKDTAMAPVSMPPPIDPVSPDRIPLDGKERRAVHLSRRWRRRQEMPVAGSDGYVRFLYGATMPTVVCAPLQICDVALQPGEIVIGPLNIGDSVHWRISPATSGGAGDRTSHLIIKPTDAGLETTLNIQTDRRTYSIKLVSTRSQWMPLVGFNYPDDVNAEWAAYRQNVAYNTAATTLPTGENIANLEFLCIGPASGGPSWTPLRAYTDGLKTYIEFPHSLQGDAAPALVALGNDGGWFSSSTPEMVNYRAEGNRYIVDAVLKHAALITGVGGDQQRVTMTLRSGCR